MSIQGVQLIYRLQDTVRLLIDYRESPTPDSFNLYWSSTSGGSYTLFAEGILNKPSNEPAIRGKILVDVIPSTISGWDNNQTNYIKLAPVTGGSVGAQEGPMTIKTRKELIQPSDSTVVYGFNKDEQKFIPLSVNTDGELITA